MGKLLLLLHMGISLVFAIEAKPRSSFSGLESAFEKRDWEFMRASVAVKARSLSELSTGLRQIERLHIADTLCARRKRVGQPPLECFHFLRLISAQGLMKPEEIAVQKGLLVRICRASVKPIHGDWVSEMLNEPDLDPVCREGFKKLRNRGRYLSDGAGNGA